MEMPRGKWNANEETKLIELWEDHRNQDIADVLGRSLAAVDKRAKLLRRRGLLAPAPRTRGNHSRDWSDNDTNVLVELWKDHSASEIATKLSTTRSAVLGKLNRLREHGTMPRQAKPIRSKSPAAPAPRQPRNMNKNRVLAVIPPPLELVPDPCRFLDLGDGRCKYALGDPLDRVTTDTLFCGAGGGRGRTPIARRIAASPITRTGIARHDLSRGPDADRRNLCRVCAPALSPGHCRGH